MPDHTESKKESEEETGSAGMAKANSNKEENKSSFELADNNKLKEFIIDLKTLLNEKDKEKSNETDDQAASDPQNVNEISELEEISISWCHDYCFYILFHMLEFIEHQRNVHLLQTVINHFHLNSLKLPCQTVSFVYFQLIHQYVYQPLKTVPCLAYNLPQSIWIFGESVSLSFHSSTCISVFTDIVLSCL